MNRVCSKVMGPSSFDPEKATEALVYVARRVQGGDLYRTLKVLYLADKCHLHRYGRFVFGDSHAALPYGPVPQGAYGIVKNVRGQPDGLYFEPAHQCLKVTNRIIQTARDADTDVFSASDLECLDEAIETAGRLSFEQLKQMTHDDAYNATSACSEIDIAAIASMAEENRAALIQHLADPHPDRQ